MTLQTIDVPSVHPIWCTGVPVFNIVSMIPLYLHRDPEFQYALQNKGLIIGLIGGGSLSVQAEIIMSDLFCLQHKALLEEVVRDPCFGHPTGIRAVDSVHVWGSFLSLVKDSAEVYGLVLHTAGLGIHGGDHGYYPFSDSHQYLDELESWQRIPRGGFELQTGMRDPRGVFLKLTAGTSISRIYMYWKLVSSISEDMSLW